MRLEELLPGADLAPALRGLEVSGLSADSRAIRRGFLFFAIPGHKGDGLDFLPDAERRGAVAVVAQRAATSALPLVIVADSRRALALAAARFHSSQPSTIALITGTSGKTSVAAFLRQIWQSLGHEAASLGTVGLVDKSGSRYGALTTPGPVELHEILDDSARRGVTHLAMEASSLGIEQSRLDGVKATLAAFTNFSRDHLDHHPSLEAYFQAKMRLFDTLMQPGQTVVVDADSDVAPRVLDVLRARGLKPFTVGARGETITLLESRPRALSTGLRLRHGGRDYEIDLPLAGAFQTSNALVAAGLAIASGDAPAEVFSALSRLRGAPGRLELVGEKNGAPVFVDYAHKPDALEKVLQVLRPLTKGRLIVVFGCGGDRDQGKRPLMGAIAARDADAVIVTDDNPRSEDAGTIRAAILAGVREIDRAKTIEIADRESAIRSAVAGLGAGDVLVVAGKGHETGQIVGEMTYPFSDQDVIAKALGLTGEDVA